MNISIKRKFRCGSNCVQLHPSWRPSKNIGTKLFGGFMDNFHISLKAVWGWTTARWTF